MHRHALARQRRLTENVHWRHLNDNRYRRLAGDGRSPIAFACECGDPACLRTIALTGAQYRAERPARILHPTHGRGRRTTSGWAGRAPGRVVENRSVSDEPDRRERRAADNESVFRRVNEHVEELNESLARFGPYGSWTCECARINCAERVELTLREYKAVRQSPQRFLVAPDQAHRARGEDAPLPSTPGLRDGEPERRAVPVG